MQGSPISKHFALSSDDSCVPLSIITSAGQGYAVCVHVCMCVRVWVCGCLTSHLEL